MVNPYRGEVDLVIGDKAYAMRLPLSVLVDLEAALETESLTDLVRRFEDGAFSVRDLAALLRAGLRGGGHEVELDVDGGPVVAARAAARLLAVTFALPE